MGGFDRDALHPEGQAAINRSGDRLTGLFVVREPPGSRETPFPSRLDSPVIHCAINPLRAIIDHALRTRGWAFPLHGQELVLDGDNYLQLRRLVEQLRRRPPFRDGFSDAFLERAIMDWCRMRLAGNTDEPLLSHLFTVSAAAHGEHVLLVPLTNVEIERNFTLGAVRVVTMDPALFEATRDFAKAKRPDDPDAGHSAERLAGEFANRAAVEVRVWGEERFSREHALAAAQDVAGVMRFLSPSVVTSLVPSPIQPHGIDPLPWTTLIEVREGRIATYAREILHCGLADWKLAARDIDRVEAGSLANLNLLFQSGRDSSYVAHVRAPFFAYCRALGRFEAAERLVATIGALEALLLRGSDEPLQNAVGERLAFLVAHNAEDRMRVVSDYRQAYRLRSRAVHHLRGIDEEDVADRLFRHAFIAFHKAIEGLSIFDHPDRLFEGLDQIKFSGGFRSATNAEPTEPGKQD